MNIIIMLINCLQLKLGNIPCTYHIVLILSKSNKPRHQSPALNTYFLFCLYGKLLGPFPGNPFPRAIISNRKPLHMAKRRLRG